LSLSTQKRWGGLQEASLIDVFFFSTSFTLIIMSVSWRRGLKWRRVGCGCPGHATIVKVEAAEACISIPLLHQSLLIKVSKPFFKGLNIRAFFFL
jgi:hypothetical protein